MIESENTPEKLLLGRITGVYGVKGWVKVFSYTDPMESILDYSPWYIRAENPGKSVNKASWTRVKLKTGKRHAKTVVVKLEHCNDRDQAMSYIGTEIAIEPEQLETLRKNNEYYWRDLIGLRVINQQNIELGVVKSLMETGANDVLVVVQEKPEAETSESDMIERLIPWSMHNTVVNVDLKQGVIEVDWDQDYLLD